MTDANRFERFSLFVFPKEVDAIITAKRLHDDICNTI